MKLRSLLLIILCITLFAGCAKKANDTKGNTTPTQTAKVTQPASATQAATATVTPAPAGTDNSATAGKKSANSKLQNSNSSKTTAKTSVKKINIRIAALKGPTAIGMLPLMDAAKKGDATNNYKFTIAGTPDEVSAGLIKGDYDVAALPCNLASVLYNKTHKIKIAGINALGVLYIVETGNSINSVKDLKGKTIYSTGLGTTPQYTLNYILKGNGINPEKDVKVEYKSEATEVAAILSKSNNAVAMLPQPYVSSVMMQNKKVHIALIVADEWEKIAKDNSTVVTGVIAVRKDFLQKHQKEFNAFLNEYSASTNYVNTYTLMASKLVDKYGISTQKAAYKAIPYCNITMLMGSDMQQKVNGYLNVLYKQNPQSVGGKLPDKDFYYFPKFK